MSSRIDRLHEEAMKRLAERWKKMAHRAAGEIERAVGKDGRRAVCKVTLRYREETEVPGEVPEGFSEWFKVFTGLFRSAEEEGHLPADVPVPPDEPEGLWDEAARRAEEGEATPLVVLAFARAVRSWHERNAPVGLRDGRG